MLLLWSMAMAQELQVSSDVEGAPIYINGSDTGQRTPATIENLTPGRVTVTVGDDCRKGEVEVTVAEGKVTKINVLTIEVKGSLILNLTPPEASVWWDGDPLVVESGKSIDVECGTHSLRVEAEGFSPHKSLVTVDDVEPVTVPVTLRTLGMGTIELSVSPRQADIFLDGKNVGSDSVSLPSVTEGLHLLRAEYDGYQDGEQAVMVGPNESLTYQIKLSPRGSKKPSAFVSEGKTSEKAAEVGARTYAAGGSVRSTTRSQSTEDTEAQARREEEEARQEEEDRREEERLMAEAEEARLMAEARESEAQQEERRSEERRESERNQDRRNEERREEVPDLPEEDEGLVDEPDRVDDPNDIQLDVVLVDEEEEEEISPDLDEPAEAEKKKKKPTFWAGIGMLGVGAVGGGGSVFLYDSARQQYERYKATAEAAQKDPDLEKKANYFEQRYNASRNLFYGTVAGAGLLLIGGTVCVLVDDGPAVTLVPGGAILSWQTDF